jgi:hypothetical protein
LLAAAQAQKHVTHNDALLRLDAIVQLSVRDRDLATPPAETSDGDRYIVAADGSGAWSEWDDDVAAYIDGAWVRFTPRAGWTAYVEDEELRLIHDGSDWVDQVQTTSDGYVVIGGTTMRQARVNIMGTDEGHAWTPWFGICATSSDEDNTSKGGAVFVGAPYHNANKAWMSFGPWDDNTNRTNFYGGGGWGNPEATEHLFYAADIYDQIDDGAPLVLQISGLNETIFHHLDVKPGNDNTYSLGDADHRWTEVFAANGTINTSDAREKTDVADSDLGLAAVLALRPRRWKARIGGHIKARKEQRPSLRRPDTQETVNVFEPRPGRRTHYGLVDQEVKEAFEELGVTDFAGWVLGDPDDPDSLQGLRYDQFVGVLVKAVQELAAENQTLKDRLDNAGF